ncbi:MAG: hypothetical protein ACYSUQ_04605 [Planctomycetota bacterium]|jgi:hypothetical protein
MIQQVLLLSLVVASVSFSVTETKLFKPLRERFREESLLGRLLSCGYCFGHWVGIALVAIYRPRLFDSWWLLDYFLTALVIAWLAGVQWALMCLLVKKAGK